MGNCCCKFNQPPTLPSTQDQQSNTGQNEDQDTNEIDHYKEVCHNAKKGMKSNSRTLSSEDDMIEEKQNDKDPNSQENPKIQPKDPQQLIQEQQQHEKKGRKQIPPTLPILNVDEDDVEEEEKENENTASLGSTIIQFKPMKHEAKVFTNKKDQDTQNDENTSPEEMDTNKNLEVTNIQFQPMQNEGKVLPIKQELASDDEENNTSSEEMDTNKNLEVTNIQFRPMQNEGKVLLIKEDSELDNEENTFSKEMDTNKNLEVTNIQLHPMQNEEKVFPIKQESESDDKVSDQQESSKKQSTDPQKLIGDQNQIEPQDNKINTRSIVNEYQTLQQLSIRAFSQGHKFGQYNNEDYKAISNPVRLNNQLIYEIESLSKTDFKGDLELRVIFFKNLNSFNQYLYGIMQYMNNLQNFKGKQGRHTPSDVKAILESFQKVFQFFSHPDYQIKGQFLLMVIQERLPSLKSFLDSLLSKPLSQQLKKLNHLLCNLSMNILYLSDPLQFGFGSLKQFIEIVLENMFYRENSQYSSIECKTKGIAVLSYPKVNTFSQEQIDRDGYVQDFIEVQNSCYNVFQIILSYLKSKGSRIMQELKKLQEKPLVIDQEIKPLFNKGDKVKSQSKNLFEIQEKGKVFSKFVLYKNVHKVVSKFFFWKKRADQTNYQLKEIHCQNTKDYQLVMDSVDSYRKGYEQIEPEKKIYFQVVHDHWGLLKNNVVCVVEIQKKDCRSLKDYLLKHFGNINNTIFRLFELAFKKSLKPISPYIGFNIDAIQKYTHFQLGPIPTLSFNYTQFKEQQQEKELEMKNLSLTQNSFSFLKNMYEIIVFTKKQHPKKLLILKKKFNFKINKNKDFLQDYEKGKKLGQSNNPVFKIICQKTKKESALKEIQVQHFAEIAQTYIESQLALLFPNNLTLLRIKDIFLEHNQQDKKPFKMSIIMDKANGDVTSMSKNGLSFKKFYPLFKDSILAVSYMHSKNIIHRDIKPGNILITEVNGKKKYMMADYGEGINLNYKAQFLDDPNYHIGNFGIAGTIPYLDPYLYYMHSKNCPQHGLRRYKHLKVDRYCQICKDMISKIKEIRYYRCNKCNDYVCNKCYNNKEIESTDFDILKSDIFSLGISLVKIALNMETRELIFNTDPLKEEELFNKIHTLKYPIQIRQCLIMMTKYYSKDRIPTVALFNFLTNFMHELELGLPFYQKIMKLQQKEYTLYKDKEHIDKKSLFRYENVLSQRAKVKIYEFGEKLRNITKKDKSHCMYDFFINYKSSKPQIDQVMLLKPCYIPCYIIKVNNNDSLTIQSIEGEKSVKASDLISIQSCVYKKDQHLQYWVQQLKKWVLCTVIEIDEKQQNYKIKLYRQEKVKLITVPFFSLKLKTFLFFEIPEVFYQDQKFSPIKIRGIEKQLFLTKNPIMNYKQLFLVQINLNEGKINEILTTIETELENNQIYDFEYQNGDEKDFESDKVLQVLSQKFSQQILIDHLFYANFKQIKKLDVLGKGHFQLQALTCLELHRLFFESSSSLESFFKNLSSAYNLKKLELVGIQIQSGQNMKIKDKYILRNTSLVSVLENAPLNEVKILIYDYKTSNILIPIKSINTILDSLSKKSLERVYLQLYSFELGANPTTKKQTNRLGYLFEQFLKSQRDFWFFRLQLYFGETKSIRIDRFASVVNFVKTHKMMIEKFPVEQDFLIQIKGKLSFIFSLFIYVVADHKENQGNLKMIEENIDKECGNQIIKCYAGKDMLSDQKNQVLQIWNQPMPNK